MGIFEKLLNFGCKRGTKDIQSQIQKTIKAKRLVFLGDNHVLYIDKQSKRKEYNFEQMVDVAIKVGGWENNMATLMITRQDVVNILTEEYAKHKKGVK